MPHWYPKCHGFLHDWVCMCVRCCLVGGFAVLIVCCCLHLCLCIVHSERFAFMLLSSFGGWHLHVLSSWKLKLPFCVMVYILHAQGVEGKYQKTRARMVEEVCGCVVKGHQLLQRSCVDSCWSTAVDETTSVLPKVPFYHWAWQPERKKRLFLEDRPGPARWPLVVEMRVPVH